VGVSQKTRRVFWVRTQVSQPCVGHFSYKLTDRSNDIIIDLMYDRPMVLIQHALLFSFQLNFGAAFTTDCCLDSAPCSIGVNVYALLTTYQSFHVRWLNRWWLRGVY